jgi:hypothetical protein
MDISTTIDLTINQLCDVAEKENKDGYNLYSAIGEVTINSVNYQIQLALVQDKKGWISETDVYYQEIVKRHY